MDMSHKAKSLLLLNQLMGGLQNLNNELASFDLPQVKEWLNETHAILLEIKTELTALKEFKWENEQ